MTKGIWKPSNVPLFAKGNFADPRGLLVRHYEFSSVKYRQLMIYPPNVGEGKNGFTPGIVWLEADNSLVPFTAVHDLKPGQPFRPVMPDGELVAQFETNALPLLIVRFNNDVVKDNSKITTYLKSEAQKMMQDLAVEHRVDYVLKRSGNPRRYANPMPH